MKLNFLPFLQMIYSSYDDCGTALETHVDPDCDYTPEYARIRHGAFIHASYYPTLNTNPTSATLWTNGIIAGKIIVSKKLSGTFDGGTPKIGPGFGDSSENTLGSDFVAVIKDQVYKENYMYYKSLIGATSWHFGYKTGTQIHISGVPISASVKNAITDATSDTIVWEATLKWFERFTPAPHDMPAGIF